MPKDHINFESFNAGEWSETLTARINLEKYQSSLRLCDGFLPIVQGGLVKRSGTRYIAEIKDSNVKARLIPFEFNTEQAYALEVAPAYIRFYMNYGQIQKLGAPYEVATSYGTVGVDTLKYDQSNDVMTFCQINHKPRYLKRLANDDWLLEAINFNPPPFDSINNTATTITASAVTGTVTLTASQPIFKSGFVGSVIKVTDNVATSYKKWIAGEFFAGYVDYSIQEFRYYENKVYKLDKRPSITDKAGTTPPVHTSGIETDGVQFWEYINDNVGYINITGYTSPTVLTGTITRRLPSSLLTGTKDFYLPIWYEGQFPKSSIYYEGRHVFSWRQRIDGSYIGEYENFSNKNQNDEITDETAISFTFNAKRANLIQWLELNNRGLTAGTSGGEYAIIKTAGQSIVSAKSPPSIEEVTNAGSADIQPVRAGNSVVFVQRNKKQLNEFSYAFERDGFNANNLNDYAAHIAKNGIKEIAFQRQPQPIIWNVTEAGELIGLTYNETQNVVAWHRHTLGGFRNADKTQPAAVESICVLPSPDGFYEDLWLIVRRHINGVTKRYIEVMQPMWDETKELSDAWFLDCALKYSGTAITTLSGLSHLNGQVVDVIANNVHIGQRTVSSGSISLGASYTNVLVGFNYKARMETQRIEGGSRNGVSQGKIKRINKLVIDLLSTIGGRYGDPDLLDSTWQYLEKEIPTPTLFKGFRELQFNSTHDYQGRIGVEQNLPYPMIIRAMYPDVSTGSL